MEWSSFVYIVDFVEVVVAAVGPEPHGVEGNGASTSDSNGNGKGIALNKDGSNHILVYGNGKSCK